MLITEPTRKAKKGGAKTTAILVAVGVHIVIALIATLFAVMPARKDEPELVAAIVAPVSKTEIKIEKKQMVKQAKQVSASAASASSMKMLRANTTAKISTPTVTKFSDGPMGIGDGDFGSGFGSGGGGGGGMGSGASFFGATATGKRFLFIVDHSQSMKEHQVRLRDKELEKALRALPGSVQYQVIIFAGGAMFASPGWELKRERPENVIFDGTKTYTFSPKRDNSWDDYSFDGRDSELPRAKWLPASSSNVSKTMRIVDKTPLFAGTDWEIAFRVGHYMDPPPDVIFFMSDGSGGNSPPPILSLNRRRGKPQINTLAMQTTGGAKEFSEIAEKTGGKFNLIDKRGKAIKGEDYFKNPAKYARDLK